MCDPSLRKSDIYSTAPEGFTRRMLASFFQLWFWYGGGGGRRAFTDLRLIHFHCHCQFALWHLFRPIIIADSYSSFRSCLRRSHLLIATYGNGSHLAPPLSTPTRERTFFLREPAIWPGKAEDEPTVVQANQPEIRFALQCQEAS